MLFDESLGHPENQQKLMNAWQANRIPHALLLHGPEGCGKEAFAIGIAQLLNAADENGVIDRESSVFRKIAQFQHPDVQFIFPTPAQSNAKPEELQAALQEKAKNPYRRVTFTGKNTFIGIDTIRELKKEAGYRLYEGQKSVYHCRGRGTPPGSRQRVAEIIGGAAPKSEIDFGDGKFAQAAANHQIALPNAAVFADGRNADCRDCPAICAQSG